ncbi:SpoIID/LytB domain-containing protein [Nitrospira lenta]|uniref:Putative Amidase enhancer protein LytB n=1 Tax=Nitrospira lenta TaxID=1436998 RepID=A0A330L188_9BACT|nr:SpoIID/LytB domain-containing protein [Nitrospira lenta]SPP63404.1 putative Amidase enhancer protein LytB [Nitrospira lenta]
MAIQTLGYVRRLAVLWVLFGGIVALSAPVQAAESIRVLMASEVHRLDVRAESVVWLTDGQSRSQSYNTVVHIELRGAALLVNGTRVAGEQLTLRAGEHDLKLWLPRVSSGSHGAALQPGDERGALHVSGMVHIVRRGKGLLVINQVDLEEYVKGVVPAEVNSTWHREMLKVQAVAARTYALYQHMLSASRDYDVASSIQDQVYRGRQGVDARVQEAVESTRGLVVTHDGAPIYAAFSSTAAGITEDAMVVWSKDLPYLKGVECPFDVESPYYQWKASFRVATLERNLRQQGFSVGTIATMTPVGFSRAGRVSKLRILHSKGELILRGEELRKAIGYTVVPSTQFTIESMGQDIVLAGYGAGHAVGLCQWGAKELAELGYSFSSILRYYYPGTELQNVALTKMPPMPTS